VQLVFVDLIGFRVCSGRAFARTPAPDGSALPEGQRSAYRGFSASCRARYGP